ncbi:hypothetical protein ACI2K4_29580 [Micromonospora sp. NPDC050397]|uniref:hypothetical protein n=1 Tax=Micromonospora sp. NPDC050397 TaxID=3364279 RepID=UPI0038506F35
MPRKAPVREERFGRIRSVLLLARQEIVAAVETVHLNAVDCLPMPELIVPEIGGFNVTSAALYANLFTAEGGKAPAWITARSSCSRSPAVVSAVYELCYSWYQLVNAGSNHIESTPVWANHINLVLEMLPGRIDRLVGAAGVGEELPTRDSCNF